MSSCTSRGWVLFCAAVVASAATYVLLAPSPVQGNDGTPLPGPDNAPAVDPAVLITSDPIAFLEAARGHYHREIRDYTCRFTKQELLAEGLGDILNFRVFYREKPLSVLMKVLDPPQRVKQVLWIKGAHADGRGREHIMVEPSGIVGLVFAEATIPIDDERIMSENRSTIAELGFRATLDCFQKFNLLARERGVLDLKYTGDGMIGGRATFVLQRRLPYDGPKSEFPEALAILHIDKEWLVPVLLESYGDTGKKQLLARYRISEIKLNVGLSNDTFKF